MIEALLLITGALCLAIIALAIKIDQTQNKLFEITFDVAEQKAWTKTQQKMIEGLAKRIDQPPEAPREIIIKDFKPIIKYRRIGSTPKPKTQEQEANIPQPPNLSSDDLLSSLYPTKDKKKSDR